MHVECAGFPIALRSEEPGDRQFVARLFASAREPGLGVTGWSEEVKAAFWAQQFRAQTFHYSRAYPDADRQIVVVNGARTGRLCLVRRSAHLRVIDIALLPEYRSRGIGTALLRAVVEAADGEGCHVSLQVAKDNPAQRLYTRLGFRQISDDGLYLSMLRVAASGLQGSADNS